MNSNRRRLICFFCLALPGALVLLLAGGMLDETSPASTHLSKAQGVTQTVCLPVVMRGYDPSYVSPFGIVMYGNVDEAAGLKKMQEAGSKLVTTLLIWSAIEPVRGQYDWSSFDVKAQNAQAAGLDVFVLFTGNPSWAAALPGGPVTDTNDLVDFVTKMAERYDCDGKDDAPGSPCVHYWSFYAEPDNGDINRAQGGKGYWGDNGAGFAAMLSEISPAIHAANPRAKVLIGGLAYDWFVEDGGPFVRSFLTDTLRALNGYSGGAKAYIDAVAFHFYPISAQRWPTIREKTMEVRGIMQRHGVGDLPLICPEIGYWSSTTASSSEEQQAKRLVQMFIQGLSVGLEHMSWFAVFDDGPGTEEHGLFWGYDLNRPKQSYYAYRALTRELAGARYVRSLQVKDVEGYVFRMPSGREKTVLWASASSAVGVPFPYACIRLVDTTGKVYMPVSDGDSNWDWDGAQNGQITLGIYPDTPFYVESCP